jgi:hypothetical protein
MGYYIFSFGINTEHIQKAFGSRNKALVEEVERNDIFQNYADNDFGDGITAEQALSELIQGDVTQKDFGYAYGYATIGLCATLGKELPYTEEIKLGVETDLINSILAEELHLKDFKIEEVLLADNSHPFPLPAIEDWPAIGLVRLEQLHFLYNKLSASNDSKRELMHSEEREYAYEHLVGIRDNVEFCIQNKLDLVSFCH